MGPLVPENCMVDTELKPPAVDNCGPFKTVREWLLAIARGDLIFE
jgi:hypothetical protein